MSVKDGIRIFFFFVRVKIIFVSTAVNFVLKRNVEKGLLCFRVEFFLLRRILFMRCQTLDFEFKH